MRVYLKVALGFVESEARTYPSVGFYNVEDVQAQKWIDEGVAFEATDDNKVIAFPSGVDVAETIDLDEDGATLDGFSSQYQPLPEKEPELAEAVEPGDSETETETETDLVSDIVDADDDPEEDF